MQYQTFKLVTKTMPLDINEQFCVPPGTKSAASYGTLRKKQSLLQTTQQK